MEEPQNYYKEYRLSRKGKHLWVQIYKLNCFARNLCSTYDESYCFNESFCCRRHKHPPFQCDYNDNETLAAYAKENYDLDRKSTRLNSSHRSLSRMPSSA